MLKMQYTIKYLIAQNVIAPPGHTEEVKDKDVLCYSEFL